jgi:hypothetical protein
VEVEISLHVFFISSAGRPHLEGVQIFLQQVSRSPVMPEFIRQCIPTPKGFRNLKAQAAASSSVSRM